MAPSSQLCQITANFRNNNTSRLGSTYYIISPRLLAMEVVLAFLLQGILCAMYAHHQAALRRLRLQNERWSLSIMMLLSIPLLTFTGVNIISALSLSRTNLRTSKVTSEPKTAPVTLSLWLIPSKQTKEIVQHQIDRLAETYGGPTFEPHVTVIGGIPCQSEKEALEFGIRLQDGLRGFGEIPCHLHSTAGSSEGVWSQALFLVMDQSDPFVKLCRKARAILGMDPINWTFAAPVLEPHMSLFYGVENIPDGLEVEPVAPYVSHTLELVRTDPSTLESVKDWKDIATISLI